MSSDRLTHLRRQQTLLREHLAWLDAEVARETAADNSPTAAITAATAAANASAAAAVNVPLGEVAPAFPPSLPAMTAAAGRTESPASTAVAAETPDELLQRFAETERLQPDRARLGCLAAAVLAFLLLGGGVALVYFLHYR